MKRKTVSGTKICGCFGTHIADVLQVDEAATAAEEGVMEQDKNCQFPKQAEYHTQDINHANGVRYSMEN